VSGTMEPIKHVVVIMLENRGFDSVLGYLYTQNDAPAHNIPALKPGAQRRAHACDRGCLPPTA